MPDDLPLRGPRITLAQFHAFRDTRPAEEKWELIDGVPMMMAPPTLIHQRISRNLESLLNARLSLMKPEWQADREIGVLVPDDDTYNPEPDVAVIDAEIEAGQVYAERFYFIAEVLSKSDGASHASGSDKPDALAAKLAFYNRHKHCRVVMIVEQHQMSVVLHVRDAGGSWAKSEITTATAIIDLPIIGPIGRLGDLYRNTPLDPFKAS